MCTACFCGSQNLDTPPLRGQKRNMAPEMPYHSPVDRQASVTYYPAATLLPGGNKTTDMSGHIPS